MRKYGHRYYDPSTGRYLSSDPLGLAAGMNTYVYAANDPINHIDPSGLLLFAFDGTNNSDLDDPDLHSNVVKFRDSYLGDPGELDAHQNGNEVTHWYYITGAGRVDARSGLGAGTSDEALGTLTGERVLIMAEYLYTYLNRLEQAAQAAQPFNSFLNLDMVGFSRGAAAARIFANLVSSFLAGDDEFMITDGVLDNDVAEFRTNLQAQAARAFLRAACIAVNLRFLGLWDTVPHIGFDEENDARESHGSRGDANFGIPARVGFTAHAVAANERRAIFDGISILNHPGAESADKIERGFIGDHTDIGGSDPRTDISDVAFMWMVQQATRRGEVPESAFDFEYIRDEEWHKVAEPDATDTVYDGPALWDEEWTRFFTDPLYEPGRYFRYLDDGEATDVFQTGWSGYGMDFASSLAFLEENIYQDTVEITDERISRARRTFHRPDGMLETPLKKVDGQYLYQQWLAEHYNLDIEFDGTGLTENAENAP